MNSSKFSSKFSLVKLSGAVLLLCAVLALSGCSFFTKADNVYGEWISTFEEKYSITITDYDNYSHYDESFQYDPDNWHLYYSTTDISIVAIDDESGFIYGKFDDENHIGYGAKVGQWYAVYYDNLTDSTVCFYQAYKADGKAACDSLKEAKKEFTLENKYFDLSRPSECTK